MNLCKRKDCLIWTCSRHVCHKPLGFKRGIIWIKPECDMYKSKFKWKEILVDYWSQKESEEDGWL